MSGIRIERSSGVIDGALGIFIESPGAHTDRATLNSFFAPLGLRLIPADAIVIERSELPEVTADPERSSALVVGGRPGYVHGYDHMPEALRRLALVEYAEARPPIDEAQVEALATDIRGHLGVTPETTAAGHQRVGHSDDLARALVAAGWKK